MSKKWMSLPMFLVFAACGADPHQDGGGLALELAPDPPASVGESPQGKTKTPIDRIVPGGFSKYAAGPSGAQEQCVAGAIVDADGLNQKPVVFMAGKTSVDVRWSTILPLPPHAFQARATHCLGTGDAVYVLVQADTQPEQTFSQTLLRAVKVAPGSGEVIAEAEVQPSGVDGAYSAWVEAGGKNFRMQNGKVLISGKYYLLSRPEDRRNFQAELDANFH